MMGLRLGLALVCHLVTCHSLALEPSTARTEDISKAKNPALSAKIIGGGVTTIENYPYVVSLQENGTFFGHDVEHFCVGNIVGEKWILTAAKCCHGKNPNQFHVRVGSDLYYKGGTIHAIEMIEIHPKYEESTWDYDVGLLKLVETIIFNEKAQPIKLPKIGRAIENGTVLDIAGWGATQLLGIPSEHIHNNTIPIISRDECEKIYAKEALTDRMFCAFASGNGPCIGDTGSPGVSKGVLIGVASWSQSCAYKHPTAYARLPEMVDWITKVTRNSSSEDSESDVTSGTSNSIIGNTLLVILGILSALQQGCVILFVT